MSKSEPPKFKRDMIDVTVGVGTSTKFLVEITSSSDLKVSWFHNDVKVTGTDRHVLLQDKGTYCLQIYQVTPTDEGKWVCLAENASGTVTSFALLNTQIPQIYKAPQFVTGLRGCLWDNGTLSLECDVMGVPTPVLRWYRDGQALSPGSALTIRAYSKESKSCLGVFACEAQNCMGSKATFSRVYARNFANFLKQCGCGHQVMQVQKSSVKKSKKSKSIKTAAGNGDVVGNRTSGGGGGGGAACSDKSDDSGIADDQHHL